MKYGIFIIIIKCYLLVPDVLVLVAIQYSSVAPNSLQKDYSREGSGFKS